MPKTALETQIVTEVELVELAELETQLAEAKKLQSLCERKTKAARLSLASKVLGIKTAEEFSSLNPEKVEALMAERAVLKFWKSERKAPPFVFLKVWEGRNPSWRNEYIKLKSEAEAEKLTANTPMAYSYRVDVALASV